MSEIMKAAAEVKKLAKGFKAIVDMGEILEGLGSLDQAAEEVQARVKAAKQAEIEANRKTSDAMQALAHAEENVKDATLKAGMIVSAAEAEASRILVTAQKTMQVEAAGIEARKQQAEAVVKAKHEEAAKIKQDIDGLGKVKSMLEDKIGQLKKLAAGIAG